MKRARELIVDRATMATGVRAADTAAVVAEDEIATVIIVAVETIANQGGKQTEGPAVAGH
jgi:hypothetical protein